MSEAAARRPLIVALGLWLMAQPVFAETPGEARFFAGCPRRAAVRLHDETNPWDLHALLYTAMSAAEVEVLRAFRDRYLMTHALGREFVKAYYRLSPPIADMIRDREELKALVRWMLKPVIRWVTVALARQAERGMGAR